MVAPTTLCMGLSPACFHPGQPMPPFCPYAPDTPSLASVQLQLHRYCSALPHLQWSFSSSCPFCTTPGSGEAAFGWLLPQCVGLPPTPPAWHDEQQVPWAGVYQERIMALSWAPVLSCHYSMILASPLAPAPSVHPSCSQMPLLAHPWPHPIHLGSLHGDPGIAGWWQRRARPRAESLRKI